MKASILLVAIVIFFSCNNQNKYTIQGSFTGEPTEEWIYLVKFLDSDPDADSARIIDGKFQFEGITDYPEVYGISYRPSNAIGIYPIFLEPADLEVVIDLEVWDVNSTVSGGKVNDEYNKFQNVEKRIMVLYDEMSNVSSEQKREIETQIESLSRESEQKRIDYIRNNPDSPISIFLYSWTWFKFSLEEQGEFLSNFSPAIQSTTIFQHLNAQYQEMIGPELSTSSLSFYEELKPLNIDLKDQPFVETILTNNPDKTILVDIWGTWCGVCVEEFPSTRKLISNLETKDISIVYLCLNCEDEDWKSVIKKEGLKGQHYSIRSKNLKRFYEEIAANNRSGVPRFLIIDKTGKIVDNDAPKPSSGKLEEILTNL